MLKISSEIQFKTGDVRTVNALQKVELHEGKEDGLPRLIHKGVSRDSDPSLNNEEEENEDKENEDRDDDEDDENWFV